MKTWLTEERRTTRRHQNKYLLAPAMRRRSRSLRRQNPRRSGLVPRGGEAFPIDEKGKSGCGLFTEKRRNEGPASLGRAAPSRYHRQVTAGHLRSMRWLPVFQLQYAGSMVSRVSMTK
jgi:hypothetical protein